MTRWTLAALALLGTSAQPGLAEPGAQAEVSGPVCMTGAMKGQGEGRTFTILVPADKVTAMEGRGFAGEPCDEKADAADKYRSEICRLAETGPAIVKDQFKVAYGVSPEELCAWIDVVEGL